MKYRLSWCEMKLPKKIIYKICDYVKEKELWDKLVYYYRQISFAMFGICYIPLIMYMPNLLSTEINLKIFTLPSMHIPIHINLHAIYLILLFVSGYIALKPIEKKSDYE